MDIPSEYCKEAYEMFDEALIEIINQIGITKTKKKL